MIDRLPQFQTLFDYNDKDPSTNEQIAASNACIDMPQHQGIDDIFFQNVKTVKQLTQILRINNGRVQSIKSKYTKAIKAAQQKLNSQEIAQILTQNADIYSKLKNKLEQIQQQVKKAKIQQEDEPQTKMKQNFYLSISKEASQVLKQQQSYEDQYKNTVKDKITRQVRLVDRQISDEQIGQYVNNPDLAQDMLQKKLYGQASTTLKNAVSDIQDKFRDIQKLEKSVLQCLQLFNELSALVNAQGERIDSIQENVARTKDYVTKAEKKLKKAKEHLLCSKKCKCLAIVLALTILIIIIIVVVATKR